MAGKKLKVDPKVIKGMAIGMGIPLTYLSGRLFMSHRDFGRIRARHEASALTRDRAATPVTG